eukprot:TRINITY_DN2753_c0_g1_i1.p1 TRINITY_DN2753_c0_g1~~TRINITY_DN2753_c0_g1_i1.p1  ORF type:complete len:696 (+),score=144.97 TRINITY_DN2753_c0_g1_i1:396-2483(+)
MSETMLFPCSGVDAVQGRRVTMEDTHVCLDNVRTDFPDVFRKKKRSITNNQPKQESISVESGSIVEENKQIPDLSTNTEHLNLNGTEDDQKGKDPNVVTPRSDSLGPESTLKSETIPPKRTASLDYSENSSSSNNEKDSNAKNEENNQACEENSLEPKEEILKENRGEKASSSSISGSNESTTKVIEEEVWEYEDEEESKKGTKLSFYGVYDGHGGNQAALLCEKLLHKSILNSPHFAAGDIEKAIQIGFEETDKLIIETSLQEKWTSGSTVVLSIIIDDTLYIANTGDSEAVLGRKKEDVPPSVTVENDQPKDAENSDSDDSGPPSQYEPILLSHKHKPSDAPEKDRIKKAGGHVVFGRVMGSLAVARSLGDRDYKHPFNKAQADFVSAEPFIAKYKISPLDQFLIISCDGLWDKTSYQQAVDFVVKCREESNGVTATAEKLVHYAIDRGSLDNVTAIVVFLSHQNSPKEAEAETSEDPSMNAYEFLDREAERIRETLSQPRTLSQGNGSLLSPRDLDRIKKYKLPTGETVVEVHQCQLRRKPIAQQGTILVTPTSIIFCYSRLGKRKTKSFQVNQISDITFFNADEGMRVVTTRLKKYDFVWKDAEKSSKERLELLKVEVEKNKKNSNQPITSYKDRASVDTSEEDISSASYHVNDDGVQLPVSETKSEEVNTPSQQTETPAAKVIGNWSRFD